MSRGEERGREEEQDASEVVPSSPLFWPLFFGEDPFLPRCLKEDIVTTFSRRAQTSQPKYIGYLPRPTAAKGKELKTHSSLTKLEPPSFTVPPPPFSSKMSMFVPPTFLHTHPLCNLVR